MPIKHARVLCLCVLGGLAANAAGCSLIERTDRPPRPARAATDIDVPRIMRGTVASEAVVDGFQPVIVHGYGLVVDLAGTGSSDVPPDVRAHMIAMASRHGIGAESSGWGSLSPEALLDLPSTAVVVVEGVVPPAAPEGTRFDVRVFTHPTSSTTSLEGGRLYTMELFPASRPNRGSRILPPTGSRQPLAIARAKGQLFINPFAEPGAVGRDTIDRRTGWILTGGVASRDMPMKLRLITPGHSRAAALQNAINTRFPLEPGQRDPTARGESDETIVMTVPPSHHDRTEMFVELIRHTTVAQGNVEGVAMTIRRYVLENPGMSLPAAWRWQALGPRALPTIRGLYDEPQELPRLAALRAGANLNDPLVTPHLISMARGGTDDTRRQAIKLLADMGPDPRIDRALENLLSDDDLETRLSAYDALVERRSPALERFSVDDKFVVDIAPSDKPMIYITQAGLPRVAIFGSDLTVKLPITVSTWSDRLILMGDAGHEQIEVYYRPSYATQGGSYMVAPRIDELVRFLGHTTAPDKPLPGLGFSYSEVVGVLHQIWRQGYLQADFRPEQDRILAAIIRQQSRGMISDRPEFSDTEAGWPEPDPGPSPPGGSEGTQR